MTTLKTHTSGLARASGSPVRIKKGILPALALAFTLSFGTAWSYEHSASVDISSVIQNEKVPSSAAADVCKSLLQISSHTPSASVSVETQRTAGKVAALGILLGARFALEPGSQTESDDPHADKGDVHSPTAHNSERSAQAVAAYRQCKKAHALNNRLASAH